MSWQKGVITIPRSSYEAMEITSSESRVKSMHNELSLFLNAHDNGESNNGLSSLSFIIALPSSGNTFAANCNSLASSSNLRFLAKVGTASASNTIPLMITESNFLSMKKAETTLEAALCKHP